jgi:hypothetical protein
MANANSGEQAQNGKLPNAGDESAQECENRIPNNGQHQCANATKPIADRTPQKRESPADQKQGK